MKTLLSKLFFISGVLLTIYFALNLWTASGSEFHQDEYQHVHVAWNTLNGQKLYQDFFETHGPISAWTFSSLLKLHGEPIASPESILFLRKVTVSTVLLSGLLMFFCLRLFVSHLTLSVLATSLFLGGITMQVTAFRIRPDIFVQLFFILSLILWVKRYRFLCGLALGLAFGFNPKFLPLNLTHLVADIFISRDLKTDKKKFLAPIAGELLVLAGLGITLQLTGIFGPAMDSLFRHNFSATFSRLTTTGHYPFQLFKCFLELDKALLAFTIVGAMGISFFIWKKRSSLEANLKMLIALVFCSLVLLVAPLWHHSLILTVPVFILAITYVAEKLSPDSTLTEGVYWIMALLTLYSGYKELPKYTANLSPNFDSLKKVLAETDRSQPIFYVWPSRCPAYVFNSDDNKYWLHDFKVAEVSPGTNTNRFTNPAILWVAVDSNIFSFLNPDEKNTLETEFQSFGCLWKRIPKTLK